MQNEDLKNRTTDNNLGKFKAKLENLSDFWAISNKTLEDLEEDNPNLFVFPPKAQKHKDDIEKLPLFTLYNETITTNNFMGFISRNETQLSITSRFYTNENDYFLHYMLQKVFKINILDFKINTAQDNIWDISLIYLFPFYLKKALNQGLYKEYQRQQYNNANVKGAINVARHIRQNMPFMGNVAYDTREHTYDNRMTQLIRHTIEYIKTHSMAQGILNSSHEIMEAVNQINFATPTYSKAQRQQVITQNIKNINHPYFTEYEFLRKICLQILRKEGLSFGENKKDKVYGLVFDGAWLWEEYLNTVLSKEGFIHPENKTRKKPEYLFEPNKWKIFPDFHKENIVLDAKYKRMNDDKNDKIYIDLNDMYQLITYMHVLKAQKGAFIYPLENKTSNENIGTLKGYGGEIKVYGVKIPQKEPDYQSFVTQMTESERILKEYFCSSNPVSV